jgi:hypothetical protein
LIHVEGMGRTIGRAPEYRTPFGHPAGFQTAFLGDSSVSLESGCRITTAPRFSLERAWAWSERLRINSGVRQDAGRFFPKPDWRPATEAEVAALVVEPHRLQGEFPREDLCLFAITEHLRSRFWSLAERDEGGSGDRVDWFPRFASELAEFARFKGLPVSPSYALDLKISRAGQPSTRLDDAGRELRLGGLGFDDSDSDRRCFGGINLGDEATGLVFLNLTPDRIRERLAGSDVPEASSFGRFDLARRFFELFSSYPIVRITLRPGEGYWLPQHGLACDGDTSDVKRVDVRLEIRGGE